MSHLLEVSNLVKRFELRRPVSSRLVRTPAPTLTAVDDVSLSVDRHRTLGIVGESGSGKTTLARCLTRLIEPDEGSVVFDGAELTALGGKELQRMRRRIQVVFQDPFSSLNPRMTRRRRDRRAAPRARDRRPRRRFQEGRRASRPRRARAAAARAVSRASSAAGSASGSRSRAAWRRNPSC